MRATTLAKLCVPCLLAALLSGCGLPRPTPQTEDTAAPPARQLQSPSSPVSPDAVPLLRLSPASLGRGLALEQRIRIDARDENGQPLKRQIETLLEADAATLRVVLLYLGQTAAVLEWDGIRLKETRSVLWPSSLRGERILSELQLALWPVEPIRSALAALTESGWSLDADEQTRTLRQDGEPVVRVRFLDGLRNVELDNLRDGYRLTIRSVNLEP